MPKLITKEKQIRQIIAKQEARLQEVRDLAPAGIEDDGTTDGSLMTWRSTINAIADAIECLDDLAADLKYSTADWAVSARIESPAKSGQDVRMLPTALPVNETQGRTIPL